MKIDDYIRFISVHNGGTRHVRWHHWSECGGNLTTRIVGMLFCSADHANKLVDSVIAKLCMRQTASPIFSTQITQQVHSLASKPSTTRKGM